MDYPYPTVSKPAKGKAAEEIKKAIEIGGAVTNEAAKETARRIIERRELHKPKRARAS